MITTPPPYDRDEAARRAAKLAGDILHFIANHVLASDLSVSLSSLHIAIESLAAVVVREDPRSKYNMILELNACWDRIVNHIDKSTP